MVTPVRIQRRRTKGFNLQAESRAINGLPAVYVGRPTMWGNPFVVGEPHPIHGWPMSDGEAVRLFDAALEQEVIRPGTMGHKFEWMAAHLHELRGKNLACFCKPFGHCHGNILVLRANQ